MSSERVRLADLEDAIESGLMAHAAGLDGWKRAAAALAEVHEFRLWSPRFPTFEAYASKRFGLKRSHAYNLLTAGRELVRGREVGTSIHATVKTARAEGRRLRQGRRPGCSSGRIRSSSDTPEVHLAELAPDLVAGVLVQEGEAFALAVAEAVLQRCGWRRRQDVEAAFERLVERAS